MFKRKWLIILLVVLLIIFILTGGFLLNKKKKGSKDNMFTIEDLPAVLINDRGHPTFVDCDKSNINIKVASEEDVYTVLESTKDIFNIVNAKEEFKILRTDEFEGYKYYRLQQKYQGLDVYGQQLVVAVDEKGMTSVLSGEYIPNISVSTKENITQSRAEEKVKGILGETAQIVSNNKVIYYNTLAYAIEAFSENDAKIIFISAADGSVLDEESLIYTDAYTYTGEGRNHQKHTITIDEYYKLFSNTPSYKFFDPTRNIEILDGRDIVILKETETGSAMNNTLSRARLWMKSAIDGYINNGEFIYASNSSDDQLVVELAITEMKHMEDIYDYYETNLQRKSYDNNGGKIKIAVDMIMDSAAWVSSIDVIGTSLNFIDKGVIGHEFTHGVSKNIVNFEYRGESGSLSEAYSDILGMLSAGQSEWVIAPTMTYRRDFRNPEEAKSPSIKLGNYYFPTYYEQNGTLEDMLSQRGATSVNNYDNNGVHHNATVVSHAAWLMYDKGAFGADSAEARKKAAKLWYRSLFLLTPNSNFMNCGFAVIQTAKNQGFTNTNVNKILNSFVETNMISRSDLSENRMTSRNLSGTVKNVDRNENIISAYVVANKGNEYRIETHTNRYGSFEFKNIPTRNIYYNSKQTRI